VEAVIAMSAITDFTQTSELNDNYSAEFPTWPDPNSAELIEASPASHVTADDSPFLFIAGRDDDLVLPAQSQHMNALLNDNGVSSDVLLVSHADHALMPTDAPISPGVSAIVGRMADFFDEHLR
jgi:dipeptidyl aminopeptidase/acylaminoacyl peptidase